MTRWIGVNLFWIVLLTSAAAANAGAFDQLSPGNQKIADALFQAQTCGGPSQPTCLSRDDIAELKLNGNGWGNGVFKPMKDQGRLEGWKNLGHVVSSSNHQQKNSSGTLITTASGRTVVVGSKGKPEGAGSWKGSPDDETRGAGLGQSNAGGSGQGRGVSEGVGGLGQSGANPGRGLGRGK